MIYDTNWHLPYYDGEMLWAVRESKQWCAKVYQKESKVCEEARSLFEGLPPLQHSASLLGRFQP